MTRGEWRDVRIGLIFISPWIVGFLAFTLYPVLASVYYSFCDYDVLSKPVWIGMLNYRDMFTDAVFWKSLFNTLYFTAFSLPLGLVLAFAVAVLLNNQVKLRPVFRTCFFLPSLVPLVAVAMLWPWIFNGSFGLLNYALGLIGVEGPNWLSDAAWTKPALVLTTLWGVGGSMVIYLAALQDVPRDLYEAADIDGASAWHRIVHITFPMVSPVIYFNLVMGIIGSFQIFTQAYTMTGPGPEDSTLFYVLQLYRQAFEFHNMGYASAMAWLLFVLVLILTMLVFRGSRGLVHYEGLR